MVKYTRPLTKKKPDKLELLWAIPVLLFYGVIGSALGGAIHFLFLAYLGEISSTPPFSEVVFLWSKVGFISGLGFYIALLLLHGGQLDMGAQSIGGDIIAGLSAGVLGAIAGLLFGGFTGVLHFGIWSSLPLIEAGIVIGGLGIPTTLLIFFYFTRKTRKANPRWDKNFNR